MPGSKSSSPDIALLLLLLGASLAAPPASRAYDVTSWLSVRGLVAACGHCQAGLERAADGCEGALPLQSEIRVRPTETSELFARVGVAWGNGWNATSPFALAPWAADLEDDVRGIGGRWDYLLGAWYEQRFELAGDVRLAVRGGVLDAADYLDDNAYANDEFAQFMNEALVNGPHGFLPSYDLGGAFALDARAWSLRGVFQRSAANEHGAGYTFAGAQLGYSLPTPLGEGHYRAFFAVTSEDFLDAAGARRQRRLAGGLSFDQQLGETFGAFLRLGWQDDAAAIVYRAFYTGGVTARGGAWGRPEDRVGAAYGYLGGGNSGVRASHVAELYYRVALFDRLGVTADAQFLADDLDSGGSPRAFLFALRVTAEF